jgi:hypothetical protein
MTAKKVNMNTKQFQVKLSDKLHRLRMSTTATHKLVKDASMDFPLRNQLLERIDVAIDALADVELTLDRVAKACEKGKVGEQWATDRG